ncbi:hypothetical protein POM88_030908 [Heracleum sosnowskyi]|uniref:Uncharacterized protein n=1 Tax=Heracleum sosnowskyi TaxID=360622 RepID=A0AAD8MG57_9APIA|nr:hypothetical protein POM88_030908 [Heracleum sosnowskyi]
MVLHLLPLIKLKLLATTPHAAFSPLFPCLAYPFVLKLCISFRYDLRLLHANTAYFSRLFLFRLGRIIFVQRQEDQDPGSAGRWRRALRLVEETISLATPAPDSQLSSEESLHAIGIIAV